MRLSSARAIPLLPALLLGLGLHPLAAQDTDHHAKAERADADQAVKGGGAVPEGWSVRTDGDAGTANVKVVTMAKGLHVTLGPAIILYRDKHAGSGPFHTLATFTQTKNATHPEGYGLFYGGQALGGKGQKYTYFLVRQDGKFLVKQRDGEKTIDITKGWVESAAVRKTGSEGTATNLLEIDHKRDPSKVVFMVNSEPVYTLDAKATDDNGAVGIRVNHNLDVHIDGFDVHR
jgi:hypothetical protein